MRRLIHRCGARLMGLAAAVSLAAAGPGMAAPPSASAADATVTTSVPVDADGALARIPATGVGMNVAVYDGNMNHSAVPGLLKDAGTGMVRYPGGSYADGYHWQTHTVEGGYVAPDTEFDTFMSTARATGAQPIIRIGAVLITPGAWPDGITGPGDSMDWNHTVMSIAGSKADFPRRPAARPDRPSPPTRSWSSSSAAEQTSMERTR
ncbi:hypothetical protein [Streptomyces cellulosae]|uniref:hypothetical protein n=1 Tax=Streptomyces cellulosae TaxID=1968 RepID=UPI0004CC400E|nr:hypothetical protein [Streptomyces cellulosae]